MGVFFISDKVTKNGIRQKRKVVKKVIITQYLFLHVTRKERESIIRYSFIRES